MNRKEVHEAIALLEQLAKKNILSHNEFLAKKVQLLAQLDDIHEETENSAPSYDSFSPPSSSLLKSFLPEEEEEEFSEQTSESFENIPEKNFSQDSSDYPLLIKVGDQLMDRFLLKRSIGSGGMGQIFEAEDRQFGGQYAIKLFHPWMMNNQRNVQNFIQEFKLMEQLTHEGIVRTYAFFEDPRTHYLFYTMELLEGDDLQFLLEQSELEQKQLLFSFEETIEFFLQLSDILSYIHRRKVVHRDLKPGNIILLKETNEVKLLDFGIAKSLKKTSTFHTGYKGTFFYIAPEQLVGGEKVTPAADVFSLGVLLYQLLTGELPVGMAILPSELKEDLPTKIDDVIRRAMHPRWRKRYQSIEEFTLAFLAAIEYRPSRSSFSYHQIPALTISFDEKAPHHSEEPSSPLSDGRQTLLKSKKLSHSITALELSHSGEVLAIATNEGIEIRDVATWSLLMKLTGYQGDIYDLCWSPDDRLLCSGGTDREVRVWDVERTKILYSFSHSGTVNAVLWGPQKQQILSACGDHRIRLWDIHSGRLYMSLKGHDAPVTSLALDKKGELFLSAGLDGSIHLWECSTGRLLFNFGRHSAGISQIDFLNEGNWLIAMTTEGDVFILEVKTNKVIQHFKVNDSTISTFCRLSPHENFIALQGEKNQLNIWDIELGALLFPLGKHLAPISDLKFDPIKHRLYSASQDGMIKIWNLANLLH